MLIAIGFCLYVDNAVPCSTWTKLITSTFQNYDHSKHSSASSTKRVYSIENFRLQTPFDLIWLKYQ